MSRRKQNMSFQAAMDMVPDDLPDGAFFAMAHEIAGLEYGYGFDELAGGGPQTASERFPEAKITKRISAKIEGLGFTIRKHDAYHHTVRDAGKVIADWWPHKRQYRLSGVTTKGDDASFAKALAAFKKAQTP